MFDIRLKFSSIPEDGHPVEVSEYPAFVLWLFLLIRMDDFYRRDKHVVDIQTEEDDIVFFLQLKRYIVLNIAF